MASDEELNLMNEAERLQSQLKKVGDPIDQSYSDFFFKKIQTKSTAAERIPYWISRVESFDLGWKEHLQAQLFRQSTRIIICSKTKPYPTV